MFWKGKKKRGDGCDISNILKSWDYDQRQEMMVRRIRGRDNKYKIQMRLDLGILQMNEDGRPDGQRPHEKESLLEYFEGIVEGIKKRYKNADEFVLDKDDCYALQQEGIQYYYRYLCFFQISDYKRAERDTARNLRMFDFIKHYAASKKYLEDFEQYRPYVMMMNTRAKVLNALKTKDTPKAVNEINKGINKIENVYKKENFLKNGSGNEIKYLKNWADEIIKKYTPTKKQRLKEELKNAVENEEYEKAAVIRDRLNKIKE